MTRVRPGFLTLVAAIGVSASLRGIELDPTFGSRGIASGPFNVGVTGLALQADGSLVTVGNGEAGQGIAMVRFTHSGILDASFGSGGVAGSFTSLNIYQPSVAIQPDGRIIVAGSLTSSGVSSFFVARYLSNGSLDPSFGSGGSVTTSLTPQGDAASSVALQTDGRIVVAGSGGPTIFTFPQNFEVVRYNTDGSLDTSFGTGGSVMVDMGGPGTSVVLRPDGRLVVGGWTEAPSGQGGFALLGLLAGGGTDPAFGIGGQVNTQVEPYAYGARIALSQDGGIVLAGQAASSTGQWVVVLRYGPDGSLDPTFASGGVFKTSSFLTNPTGLAVDGANRVLVTAPIDQCFGLLRLLANGHEDPELGPQGFMTAPCDRGGQEAVSPAALVVQPDGRIVIAGTHEILGAGYVELARYIDATAAIPALSIPGMLLLAMLLGLAGYLAIQRAA